MGPSWAGAELAQCHCGKARVYPSVALATAAFAEHCMPRALIMCQPAAARRCTHHADHRRLLGAAAEQRRLVGLGWGCRIRALVFDAP